ncbi:MAG TPA: tetratricopeptide repeat protein [Bryobacteraceae bacterium]|jgi:TPR repeat protein|nr:tetratricopeptide repeat protein [Bryobacteraceae bacterium]
MSEDAKKPSFKSDDEMWAYIEEQETLLNQLDDVFLKKPKPHDGLPEAPAPFKEMERLALDGNPSAQYNLSIAYRNGDGVTRDFEKSAHWLLKAAEAGFAPAEFDIGCHWLDAKKTDDAFRWFMKAARQNYGPAQFNIGTICGKSGNYSRAYCWFYLAEQNRVDGARHNREIAAARLSKEEMDRTRIDLSILMTDLRKAEAG